MFGPGIAVTDIRLTGGCRRADPAGRQRPERPHHLRLVQSERGRGGVADRQLRLRRRHDADLCAARRPGLRRRGSDDTISGTAGNDRIAGNDGNDSLSGQAGNDTLDGGVGNDSLVGGSGNDVYLFGLGGGQDVIDSTDGTASARSIRSGSASPCPRTSSCAPPGNDLVVASRSIDATR